MKVKMIVLMMALLTFAVATQAQVSFGIAAGVNVQNITGKDYSGNDMNNSVVARFNGGVKVQFAFADDFNLQTGLLYAGKGSKIISANIMLNYLELPINLLYRPVLGRGRLLLGFGPYLAYAVGGKIKYDGISTEGKVTFKNSVGAADTTGTYFKPFEMGANMFAGYEFANRFSVQLNAQLGMTKINPSYANTANKTAIKNSGFGVSVGYRFN